MEGGRATPDIGEEHPPRPVVPGPSGFAVPWRERPTPWSAYPTPEYKSKARALQREVKARVREFRNETWTDLMEQIKPSHKAFWAITKALKTEGYTPIPPFKKPDNSVAIEDAEIAECLADSIETQCSHASPPHDIAHISRIEEEVLKKTSLEPKDDLAPVSLSEVQTLVKSFNTRKAQGLDRIRGGDYRHPQARETTSASYRPISLLSGLGKLFEKILKTRLSDHLLGKGLIVDEQFGFRPVHSCPQQVLRLVEYVSEGFETERSTVAVFFDVAKAFDRVWHAGLIYKLYSLQVPDRLIITIQNYLANRYFTFRHERTHSTRRLIRAGVPQGSTLSPLLYSAYTNDIPRPSSSGVQLALFADNTALFYGSRNRSSGGARRRRRRRPPTASRLKGPRKQKSFAYKLLKRGLAKSFAYKLFKRGLANLMSPTSTSGVAPLLNRSTRFTLLSLQRAIDELGQWFRKWRIEVNPDKSAAIQFKYGKIRSRLIVDKNTPNLKTLDANIPWQRNYKYLGVTLDKNLHFRDHIECVRNNAFFYKARLGVMVGGKSKLPRRNKRTIYKICIRTVMTYASPVFAHAAPKALHRLQVIQNKFSRAATNAHWCVRIQFSIGT
ncbi:Probable RNA-directed DNA polymerase from transposon BS [Eumeta japonica]|uniref:Probable RNA-directed DNA polymerase from transposon BS n=1 Tax=Eumeta variegata TaxID=151549 RepID=A0A4C1U3U4_EUMVA|nr:Probable RNA-directed DNA polymerase from transposon BS [Eumeta japonica]